MENRIFVISEIPSRILNEQDTIEIFHSDIVRYELENLTVYNQLNEVIEEAEQIKYDKEFVQRLVKIRPVYKAEDFLNFHYNRSTNKIIFLNHLKYEILAKHYYFVDPPKGSIAYKLYKDRMLNEPLTKFIKEWIHSAGNPNKQGISYKKVFAICLRILDAKHDYNFEGHKKEVEEFAKNFINPYTGKEQSGAELYKEFNGTYKDIVSLKSEYPNEYEMALIEVNRIVLN